MDVRPTFTQQIQITLGASNVVTAVTLPSGTNAFRIFATNDTRFNLDAAPATLATGSGTAVAATSFGLGGTAKASTLDIHQIPEADGFTTILYLASTTAATVVTLEVF